MHGRRPHDGRRAAWTLVLAAGAFLALFATFAIVAPRGRMVASSPDERPSVPDEHEPPPAALVPSPAASARASDASAPRPADPPHEPVERPSAVSTPVAELEVRVTSDAGERVAGATVELLHSDAASASTSTLVLTTDAAGRLQIPLSPGSVRAAAWTDAAAALPASATLTAGATATLELVLAPAYPVAGRVVDATTGAPLAGARVAFWTFAESDAVTTAADGTFRHPRFPGSAPAQQVCASAAGHARDVRYLRIDREGGWKLSAASPGGPSTRGAGTPWLELALLPELRVRGRVVDPGGRACAGVRVAAEGFFQVLASVASRDRAEVTSAADGAFELAGLRPDAPHALTLTAPGLAFEPLALAPRAGVLDAGELVLAPSAFVAGAVVDAAGVPLAGVEVVLHERAAPGDAAELETACLRLAREHRTRTGPDGAFVLDGFLPRAVTLTVDHGGAAAELELLPRSDGTFDSPVITPFPPPVVADAPR